MMMILYIARWEKNIARWEKNIARWEKIQPGRKKYCQVGKKEMKIASWLPDLTFIDGDVLMECSDINPESTVVLSLGCDALFEVKKKKKIQTHLFREHDGATRGRDVVVGF